MLVATDNTIMLYDLDNDTEIGTIPYVQKGYELVTRRAFTYSYTVAAGESISISANNFGLSTPEGYTLLGLRSFDSGSLSGILIPYYVSFATGTQAVMKIRNISASNTGTASATATVIFEYIKSQFVVQ